MDSNKLARANIACTNDLADIDCFANYVDEAWLRGGMFLDDLPKYSIRHDYVMATGLAGEVGEVLELLKKEVRDGTSAKAKLVVEAGDVLFYLCKILHRHGLKPSEAMSACRFKIQGRLERGTLRGSGDDR